jgi:excisionase family DNA binding protein
MMVAGLVVPALVEATEQGGGLKAPDFEFADDFWTVKELASKLKVSTRTVYARIKSGAYLFAIADGRSIRISRLGFQRWQKNHQVK